MKEIRNTAQKELVYSLVKDNYSHPTADEIYDLARKRKPNISRGTVYRNLNMLSDQGTIKRLSMPFGADHFDYNTDEHCHFICRECCKLFDADIKFNLNLNEGIIVPEGFKAERCKLIIIGLCSDCNID